MRITWSDLAEAQGRAYARALLEAERIRSMSLEAFASRHGIQDPDEPGVTYRWDRGKPAWFRHADHSEGPDWSLGKAPFEDES